MQGVGVRNPVGQAWSSGGLAAVRRLLETSRGPIVRYTDDQDFVAVTFAYETSPDVRQVAVLCAALPDRFVYLDRIADGPVFASTFLLPASLRVEYCYLPDPPDGLSDIDILIPAMYKSGVSDPHNPVQETIGYPELRFEFTDSVLTLPRARPQPWVDERPGAEKSTLDTLTVRSSVLGNERQVCVHPPRAVDSDDPLLAVLVLDAGHPWWRLRPTFDNLRDDGATPPFLGVAVSSLGFVSRQRELAGDMRFVSFLVDELLPILAQRYPLRSGGHIVAGASIGALGAAYAALRAPEVFPCFLSISATLHVDAASSPFPSKASVTARRWIVEEYERATGPFPEKAYLSAGNFEQFGDLDYQRDTSRMADVLRSQGIEVFFDSADTAHDTASFRGYLGDGLVWALK